MPQLAEPRRSAQSVPTVSRARRHGGVLLTLAPVVTLAVVLGLWAAASSINGGTGPSDLFAALGRLWHSGEVVQGVATSLSRGVPGFLLSVLVGTVLALGLSASIWLRAAVAPYMTFLLTLPTVAWVPLAILFFGVTDATVYFVVLTGAVPAIVNGLLAGVDQIQPLHRKVGRVLGAGTWDTALHIVLPAALPAYISGLRQGWAFSWRALMAAEIIAGGQQLGLGLGTLLQRGRELDDVGGVMATILLILVVGVVIEVLVFGPLERHLLRRRGLLTGGSQ
ncbi:ABC transporter permease [Arthrobacter parietis]|uniref:ABC transporter permease subunit n=2 Tax=Arthrobacter TaxID=1663 RepID=A0ABT6D1N2_9MICC|nr:ABC transporter permease subunit [Arthrobacter vasquezii]MDF9278984.1 ABC transporter permease subunit [Arthrobacter vasquezii]